MALLHHWVQSGVPCRLSVFVLLDQPLRAMYDAYKAPSLGLEHRQLLAWNMVMVRYSCCNDSQHTLFHS